MTNEPSGRRRRRGKILYVLLLGLLVTGFVPVLFVAQKLTGLYEEELRSTLGEKQFILAAAISEALETHVEGARSRVAKISETMGALAGSSGAEARRLTTDRRFLARFLDDDLILLRFQDRKGKAHQAQAALQIPGEMVDRLLSSGVTSGEELISQPTYLPELGIPVVVITRPVKTERGLAGMLSAVFNLQPIWDSIIHKLNVPYTAYVLDAGAHVVLHTEPEVVGRAMAPHELVQHFQGPFSRDRITTTFLVPGRQGDVQVLGTKMATNHGWGIFVQVEEDLAFAAAAFLKREARNWALFTLALGIGAAVLFAGYLTRPIHKLAEVSRAFARGDFTQRVEVSAGNELGELAETFNRMSDDIQQYIQRLKTAADENHELFMGTIQALATAIDEKDPYTRGHSERVNRLALILGKHLELSDSEMHDLHVTSLLHDIGKIGIDDRILRKPASLTDEEFEVMKQHPVRGAKILVGVPGLERLIPGMKHHHERFGGGGYPDGLVGEQIPLHARILQIADAYDAMTTNRPYQRAMKQEAAVARINELSGSISDPRIVAAFNRAYRSGDLQSEMLRPGAPTARAIRASTGVHTRAPSAEAGTKTSG